MEAQGLVLSEKRRLVVDVDAKEAMFDNFDMRLDSFKYANC